MIKFPYMCKIDSKEKREVTSFCNDVNIYGDSLDEELKNKSCDFIIQTITGLNILDINLGIYNQLRDYIKENFGKISFSYFDDYIREITIGNFSCGPVLSGNFSNKEIRDRSEGDKVCYGVIPTFDNKDRLFINWNDKVIHSDDVVRNDKDYKNVHIGDYYFNIDDILSTCDNPFMTRFTIPYLNQLQEDVLNFDKEGNLVDCDIYVNYLDSKDGINFKVSRVIHNQLEGIDDVHASKDGGLKI